MVAILDFVMAALYVDVCACNVHVKCNVIVFFIFKFERYGEASLLNKLTWVTSKGLRWIGPCAVFAG